MSESDIVKDFLVESYENLDRLDRDLVGLEKNPQDREALAGVFRTIHTIKGTCGFLGFNKLEKVAHVGENLLTRLRDGKLTLNPEITTGLLGMVDAVRQMLKEIESTGQDGNADYPELRETLTKLQSSGTGDAGSLPAMAQSDRALGGDMKPLASQETAVAAQGSSQTTSGEVLFAAQDPDKGNRDRVHEAPAKPEEVLSPPPAPESRTRDGAPETIRVGVNLLDKLMTLVGELVLARNQLLQFSNNWEDTSLQAVSQRMNLIATELQEEVMKTRMQPIGNIWGQFPRTVRDVALNCGKQVNIEMEGKETELDKTIIEAIKDPLTHLVRNSVDHGIELPEDRVKAGKDRTGRLILRAFHEGGQSLAPGHAWIAPGNFHMTVAQAGLKCRLDLNQNLPEHSCRPAVDPLFRSVAEVFRANVLGVVMTGMGSDGVLGSQNIREAGGEVIIQDEASSVVWGMPGLVYAAGQADAVYPLDQLAPEITRRVCCKAGRLAPA